MYVTESEEKVALADDWSSPSDIDPAAFPEVPVVGVATALTDPT
jgi:hypothetical protein